MQISCKCNLNEEILATLAVIKGLPRASSVRFIRKGLYILNCSACEDASCGRHGRFGPDKIWQLFLYSSNENGPRRLYKLFENVWDKLKKAW